MDLSIETLLNGNIFSISFRKPKSKCTIGVNLTEFSYERKNSYQTIEYHLKKLVSNKALILEELSSIVNSKPNQNICNALNDYQLTGNLDKLEKLSNYKDTISVRYA